MTTPVRRSIADLLEQSRARLARLHPHEAYAAQASGAVLVDIRPQLNRETEGEIPGALVIERNVLEWRLDPTSDACLPIASYHLHVVVVCNEGYASSLAATALKDLGIGRSTDLVGGYRAWRAAGFPIWDGTVAVAGVRTASAVGVLSDPAGEGVQL